MRISSPSLQYIQNHVDSKRGFSNELVRKLARRLCRTPPYEGTFSADEIPQTLAKRRHFVIIVNLTSRKKYTSSRLIDGGSDGHFVCVVGEPRRVLYLDSLGGLDRTNVCRPVGQLLQKMKKPIVYIPRRLQSRNGAACAIYALLFAIYYARQNICASSRLDTDENILSKFAFYDKAGRKNDVLCMKYLEQIINDNKVSRVALYLSEMIGIVAKHTAVILAQETVVRNRVYRTQVVSLIVKRRKCHSFRLHETIHVISSLKRHLLHRNLPHAEHALFVSLKCDG